MSDEKRCVLIPVDGSEHSQRAFEWFVSHMWRTTDEVVILHVSDNPSLPNISLANPVSLPADEWKTIMEGRIKSIQDIEYNYTARCGQLKMKFTFIAETSSKPGEMIVNVCRNKNVDTVVMGSRGLGKIRRTFVGSVSDYVLHHLGKPVTVVPPVNA